MPLDRAVTLAGTALGAAYLLARTGTGRQLDAFAARTLAVGRGPFADRVIAATTDIGSIYGAAGMTAALAAGGRRRLAGELAAATSLAWAGAQAAKPLLPRERPYEQGGAARLVAPPAGSSWPSGHAAVAAAAAATVAPERGARTRAVLAGSVAAVGASRLYVGVHHLSDVVAGIAVGVLASRVTRAARGWCSSAARSGDAQRQAAADDRA